MKRSLFALLLLACLTPFSRGADKLKELVVHPGETVYAHFEVLRKNKIKLIGVSQEPNTGAQVIFSLVRDEKTQGLTLKVENKFPQDLIYRAEVRSKTLNLRTQFRPTPVVGNKLAFEIVPSAVEVLAAFDFKLEK